MSQAVVDPGELRHFAQCLRKFNEDLRQRSAILSNQLTSLGATWRDQEHKRFVSQFQEHLQIVARFADACDQHIPYLTRKADQIDEYLRS
jgi:uncharacterized protein YukE